MLSFFYLFFSSIQVSCFSQGIFFSSLVQADHRPKDFGEINDFVFNIFVLGWQCQISLLTFSQIFCFGTATHSGELILPFL
jgi:hypothetical protein